MCKIPSLTITQHLWYKLHDIIFWSKVYKNLEYYEDKGLYLFLYYTVIKVNVDITGKEKPRKLDVIFYNGN